MLRGRRDGGVGEDERLGLVVLGEAVVARPRAVVLVVLEEVDGALFRAAALVEAAPADEEEEDERERERTDDAADDATDDRADVLGGPAGVIGARERSDSRTRGSGEWAKAYPEELWPFPVPEPFVLVG